VRWVFGYGSLIWRPGFVFAEQERALLRGAHRSLCIYSHTYRGTPEVPGLVFGLARGGSCGGMAFGVDEAAWPETLEYLREREQVGGVYREAMRPVRLQSGRMVEALAFLVDEGHDQYAGRLTIEEQAELVRRGYGDSGANLDYVLNTVEHLKRMGIRDRALELLALELEADPGPAAALRSA
jgi:glutathione-specific gamma-glutamylcyclotransferase